MAKNPVLALVRKLGHNFVLALAGGDKAKAEQIVKVAAEKVVEYPFITLLNDRKAAKRYFPLAIANSLKIISDKEVADALTNGNPEVEAKARRTAQVLAVAGTFENVIMGDDGYPINPVMRADFFAAPGNDNTSITGKDEKKHAGIWAIEHEKYGKFVNISLKTGDKANVSLSMLDSNGDFVVVDEEMQAGLFVGQDLMIKADIRNDLGGDQDLFEEVYALAYRYAGKRADLTIYFQEKGGVYLDGKKKMSTQRVCAIVLIERLAATQVKTSTTTRSSRVAVSKVMVRKDPAEGLVAQVGDAQDQIPVPVSDDDEPDLFNSVFK